MMEAETLDWLTAEYVQKILRDYENDNSILVTSLMCEPATGKGDNYASIITRAKVEYSSSKSGVEENKKRSLIVKSSPTTEGHHKDMIQKSNIFDMEIKMLETTLKQMNEILNENDYRLNARILHTQNGDPSVLVMEDLIALGYRPVDRQTRLDLDHCVIALQGLAKFHASSIVLYEKDPDSLTTYNMGLFDVNYPPELKSFFKNAAKGVGNAAKTWNELGPKCSEKLSKFVEVAYEKTAKVIKPKNGEFNVLNHGDFWISNMLFRYDTNGKVNGHIFVDFPLALYTTPAIDLLYFFATSISEDVELNHTDVLIEKYLETLTSTMQRLGCRTKAPTLVELKARIKERELFALMASCVVLPLVLADRNDVASMNEIIDTDGDSPIYKGLAFRKTVVKRLLDYDSRGLLND